MSIFAKYQGQRVSSLPAGYMQAEAQRANLISEGVKDFGRAIEGYAQQKAEDRIRDERIEALVGASTDPAYQRESSLDAALVKAKETDDLMLDERRRQIREEQAAAKQSLLDKQTQALMDNERARLAEQAHGKAMTAHLEKHKRGVNVLRGFAVPNAALRALGATAKMKKDQALASQAAANEAEAALPKFLEDKAKESNALIYTDAQDAVRAEPWKYAEAIESPEQLQEDMVNAVGPNLLKKFQSGNATKGDKLVLLEKLENFASDQRQRNSLQGQRAQQLLALGEQQIDQGEREQKNNEAMAEFTRLITRPLGSEDVPWNRALPGEPEDIRTLSGPEQIDHKYTRAREWIDQNESRLGPANTAKALSLLDERRRRDAFTMASDEIAGLPEAARERAEQFSEGWKIARASEREKIKLGQDLGELSTFDEVADTYTSDTYEGGKLVARRFMQRVPGGGTGNDVALGEERNGKFSPAPGVATSGTSADTFRFFREKDRSALPAEDSLRNHALSILRRWQTDLGPQGATALQGQINRSYGPIPGLSPAQQNIDGVVYKPAQPTGAVPVIMADGKKTGLIQLPNGSVVPDPYDPINADAPEEASAAQVAFNQNIVEYLSQIKTLRDTVEEFGTYESPWGFGNAAASARLKSLPYKLAILYAKVVDPNSVAREGEVEAAKKYLVPLGVTQNKKETLAAIDEQIKEMQRRSVLQKQAYGREIPGLSEALARLGLTPSATTPSAPQGTREETARRLREMRAKDKKKEK